MKISIRIFSVLVFVVATSQLFSQDLKTKDGIVVGDRQFIINAMKSGYNTDKLTFQNIEIDVDKYCNCFVDNIFPRVTNQELRQAIDTGDFSDILLREDVYSPFASCLGDSFKPKESYKPSHGVIDGYSTEDLEIETSIWSCVNDFNTDPNLSGIYTENEIKTVCECLAIKAVEADYSYGELLTAGDEDEAVFNEYIMPCINDVVKNHLEYASAQIIKGPSTESVPIVPYFDQQYKVKITIGGVSKYYAIDTGASDLIINDEIEKALTYQGVLKPSSYGADALMQLADGSYCNARTAVIDNVEIGSYSINKVSITIIDGGALLAGISLLNAFSRWEIKASQKVLQLTR